MIIFRRIRRERQPRKTGHVVKGLGENKDHIRLFLWVRRGLRGPQNLIQSLYNAVHVFRAVILRFPIGQQTRVPPKAQCQPVIPVGNGGHDMVLRVHRESLSHGGRARTHHQSKPQGQLHGQQYKPGSAGAERQLFFQQEKKQSQQRQHSHGRPGEAWNFKVSCHAHNLIHLADHAKVLYLQRRSVDGEFEIAHQRQRCARGGNSQRPNPEASGQ
ncbi:hypothetical protein SDC9_73032 [bioreactor metagenome]|uniref:Uncharacterized protein n=1 Tax=bioreactor metagenome TaxID=1076179 RepID=A0A644YEX6_9ZZZZ